MEDIKEYEGFLVQNKLTGKTVKYLYQDGAVNRNVEEQAIVEQMEAERLPRNIFRVSELIKRANEE